MGEFKNEDRILIGFAASIKSDENQFLAVSI
jgi:hypothetical protein